MTPQEVIKTLELVRAEVEWNYPPEYATALNEAIKVYKRKFKIKKCALCGRYFIPNEINEKYCKFGNLQYGGKLCSLVAKDIKQRENLDRKPLQRLDKKIYDRLQKRGRNAPESHELLSKYIYERDRKKKDIKYGKISEQEYADFLHAWDEETMKQLNV